jgi:molybdopterin-guanine dinucleotide biosynthesis protein A
LVSAVSVTGIVLAGGRATRFGANKLAVRVDGRPLLHHAILAVATVSDEVVVVIGSDGAKPRLPADAEVRVRVVRDVIADGGPLAGLAAGLAAARGRLAVLVGGDQPSLSPAVLAELLLWLGQEASGPPLDAVALVEDGLVRPLPAALRVATVRPMVAALLERETRSLVALFERLRVGTLQPEHWRVLDPDGASLRDVDVPADLPRR